MTTFVHKTAKRFVYVFQGIWYALRKDSSFKTQFYFGLLFVAGFSYFMKPLSQHEFVWLILSWFLVLITELQNSAFELALDKLHPERHDHIGKSKDMAAGAVFIAALFALFITCLIVYNRLG